MTDPAITRAGVARVFPRTIDVAVERINIGAAGNRSAAIHSSGRAKSAVYSDIFVISFFFLGTREADVSGTN